MYCYLFLAAKTRGIAIPSDLETQVTSLFNKAAMLSRQTSKWLQAAKTPKMERSQSQVGCVLKARRSEFSVKIYGWKFSRSNIIHHSFSPKKLNSMA
jgi:hypothetical protein